MNETKRKRRREEEENESNHEKQSKIPKHATSSSSSAAPSASDGPLSSSQLQQFIRDGFVLLPNAFSSDKAKEAREKIWKRLEEDGILKNDRNTWVERHSIPGTIRSE